jgi:hypothetical protein
MGGLIPLISLFFGGDSGFYERLDYRGVIGVRSIKVARWCSESVDLLVEPQPEDNLTEVEN